MAEPSAGALSVGALFDAAEEGFALWSPLLWNPVGEAVVHSAALRPGERVLDACCGAGSSAIPAATAVGPTGHVDAVDLAGALVAAGRTRAAGLDQLHFHTADVTTWSADGYDAVLCVFGVFFLPDMDAGAAHLLGRVRPGGRIAVTTWEHGSVEPLVGPFAMAAEAERAAAGAAVAAPNRSRSASERVSSADGLAGWLADVGATDVRVDDIRFDVALDAERAWQFVTGAGTRAMLGGLDDAAVNRVRARYLRTLAENGTTAFHVAALTAVGEAA